ncbi:MAG: MBL fold metallo-hydrolase [Bacteroidales bacterium]|nr:MBL fold metallo-hydrolase [Bacteroidales bacterium]
MKLKIIDTGNLKLDGGAMFGVVPKSIWSKKYPCEDNNLCNWAMRCLLVDYGDKVVLIDNGMGTKQEEKFFSHYYPNGEGELISSLAKAGYKPEDITDMVLTHLHFDHCGGGVFYNKETEKHELQFPNANYIVSKQQWEWAVNPNNREKASFLKENILPMIPNLVLIEESKELFPGFRAVLFDGHTDGQLIPHIQYNGKTIVFMADLLPSTAHIPLPWVMSYDTRPLLTLKEKEDFLIEAAENEYVLFFEHDLYNECCTVEKGQKGIQLKKGFKLEEIL